MKFKFLSLVALLFLGTMAMAQIKTPAASPLAKVSQNVGLIDIDIEYSRPSMKGRTIFGGLVPYNELWRTGANTSTKVEFSGDVKVAGKDLKKGKYALYTIPGEKQWTIIFHNNITHHGIDGYDEAEDAIRFTAPAMVSDIPVETFTIEVANIRNDGADIEIAWDDTRVLIPVFTYTDKEVFASIDRAMAGPSANDYLAAAGYYAETGKDLDKALEWYNKGIDMGGEKFWILRRKALLQAQMGDKKGAIATAKRSLELATEAGNKDYVRMNKESLKEWGAK